MLVSYLTIVIIGAIISAQESRCEENYPWFSTKTSYFENMNPNTSLPMPDGCKPVLLWHLARHGTRNPGDDDILELARVLPPIRDNFVAAWNDGASLLDEETINKLKDWDFTLTVNDTHLLTESGWMEHYGMGTRWRARMDQFINVNSNRTWVYSSSKTRCINSGKAFLEGFSLQSSVILIDDHKLRFCYECTDYIEQVDEADAPRKESLEFETTEPFLLINENILEKTGVYLTKEEAELCWSICRYELAWYPEVRSPWCNIFSTADLKAYEFREDLKYYYVNGYGYNVTRLMTQPLWDDIMQRLENIETREADDDEADIILNFAHSETVHPFIASLGIFKDKADLKASDWPAVDRAWRSSRMCSFAGNVDLLVNQCQLEGSETEYRVSLFSEEHQINFPSGLTYLTLNQFKSQYQYLAELDFDQVCGNDIPSVTLV